MYVVGFELHLELSCYIENIDLKCSFMLRHRILEEWFTDCLPFSAIEGISTIFNLATN